MSLTFFFGVLTLTPAVLALVLLALGLARRASAAVALALAALGALVPAVCLVVLAPTVSPDLPLDVTLFNGLPTGWFTAAYRADAFSLYTSVAVAFVVAPLLLWFAWRGAAISAAETEAWDTAVFTPAVDLASEADAEDEDEGEAPAAADEAPPTGLAALLAPLDDERWRGLALVLGVETAALQVVFASNLLWVAFTWVALGALAWGLGELGSEGDMLDWPGLAFIVAGPLVWLGAMLLIAPAARATRFFDLMGHGGASSIAVVLLALAIALAGGAYPFTVWVRRRAAFATPAGVGALLLLLLPVALVVAARSYSAIEDSANLWPQIGVATPPFTVGIAFTLLGALTLGVAGLLALGKRDARSLLALLASAEVGWGMVALGIAQPGSIMALVVLLATGLFGLGAMLSALVASQILSTSTEPDGAGPRPFAAPLRPLNLFAWLAGASSLLAVPLFPGFVGPHLLTAAALHASRVAIPLVAVAWAGDALLAVAVIRATVPVFTAVPAEDAADLLVEPEGGLEQAARDDATDDLYEADEPDEALTSWEQAGASSEGVEVPGMVLGLLALTVGIAPEVLLSVGGLNAAGMLLQPGALVSEVQLSPLGYSLRGSQWLPGLAWLALALLVALVAGTRFAIYRSSALVALQPEVAAEVAEPTLVGNATRDDAESADDAPDAADEAALATLVPPVEAWSDLAPLFGSRFLMPGGDWLLAGVEDDLDEHTSDSDHGDLGDELDGTVVGEGEEPAVEVRPATVRAQASGSSEDAQASEKEQGDE